MHMQGILSAADAERAVDAGVDGIVVSNHGGRQLDTAPASLDALPAVATAVGKRVPVLMDGGIRRGTDIIKVCAYLAFYLRRWILCREAQISHPGLVCGNWPLEDVA